MKYNYIIIFLLTTITGCKKAYFDAVPKDLVSTGAIFKNKTETENWLASVYSFLIDPWSTTTGSARYWANYTEELEPASATLQASGSLTGVNAVNLWTNHYQGIRMANIFIKNIENSETNLLKEPNGKELMDQYKGEARFLRAYYYWNLMKLYGPVVLVGDEPGKYNDDFQIPRNTWKECVDYVLAEMDAAYKVVPDKYLTTVGTEDATQSGRINKLVIEAVKSQVLLFDASPLYNGNPDFANFKNNDGTLLMNTAYDADKWTLAAEAAKVAIDHAKVNGKSIFVMKNADPFVAAITSYRELFLNGWATEGIWTRANTGYQAWEAEAAPRAVNGTGFNASLAATQEMVDKYRMSNGKAINEAGSNYNANGFTTTAKAGYYVAGTSNMYVNREPRFYNSITFNGATIPFVAKTGQTYVQFWPTGNSGNANGAETKFPKTGYLVRKHTNPSRNFSSTSGNVARPAMYIRLAELYLNYAEALNESEPVNKSKEILDHLNAIRVRGGLAELLPGLSQAEMRKQIQTEKCIEMAYEGCRFFDLRRWKIANTSEGRQGGDFTGMNVYDGASLSDPAFYVRTRISTRVWDNKYYIFPIPQGELNKNFAMVQAPGY
ncbi:MULTISPECIES: RagB/SusD family nutrient uptake outer membrane protein [Niastella]|uniref:RagB/SusD family nutrient uptake outer membrane protein n=1 Tax=Niastella soli TaxID=2821487 RepID=A0ABS3Z4N9_9BACT|nr:RagB/SusD family nutrient uptake outer membrane protein [Niastella soli]MBO9205124.1 RagB/SusD family nutrient uptake outer membrane protein [Niastella soli]